MTAERKVEALLTEGACVEVVSPEVTVRIGSLAKEGKILWTRSTATEDSLGSAFLAVFATGDEAVDATLAQDLRGRGVLICSASHPEDGDVYFASCPPISKMVSTSGSKCTAPVACAMISLMTPSVMAWSPAICRPDPVTPKPSIVRSTSICLERLS